MMPALAPAAVSMTLLGPGVTAATKAKTRNEYACSALIPLFTTEATYL
jgi:hypothetical protein